MSTDYPTFDYVVKNPERVDAFRFDGTIEHARWIEAFDDDHMTVMFTMYSTKKDDLGPYSIKVDTQTGEMTARKGDWIVCRGNGSWSVLSDRMFHARFDCYDTDDEDDPYNREEA